MALSVEQRIAILEQEVSDHLKAQRASGRLLEKIGDGTIGMFSDNPGVQEIFAEAMKLREADRKKARRPKRRKRPIAS